MMHICEHCGENNANVHIRQITDDKETELYICSKCAEKIQKKFLSFLKVNNFITSMMKEVKPKEEGKVCPVCKFDINKIRKFGKVGCAMCYEVFETELEPILSKMNVRKSIIDNKTNITEDIVKLQLLLKEAIEKEEYEKAAVIRDKIRALKGETHDNMAKNRS